VHVNIPPLRDRENDIMLISEFYLNQFAGKYGRLPLKFTSGALDKLKKHSWPGNIRELRHTIEKAVILCERDILTPDDFAFSTENSLKTDIDKRLSLEEGEKLIINNALLKNNWNISEAAKELGIGRQTLYRKIEKFGL